MTPRSLASRRALGKLYARIFVAVVVAGSFFACGEDSGRQLKPPGEDAGSGNEGGGAGGEGGSASVCGDGKRTTGEECDDENRESGDGCDARCHIEPARPACGNGVTMG